MTINNIRPHNTNTFLFFLMLVFIAPDFIYYRLGLGNFSLSTLVALTVLFVCLRLKWITRDCRLAIALVFFILILNIISSFFVNGIADLFNIKVYFSVVSLLLMVYFASCFANNISYLSDSTIKKASFRMFYILCAIGMVGAVLIIGGVVQDKSMVFFSEPSAFALIFLPFFSFALFYARGTTTIIIFIVSFSIALAVQNLTLLVGLVFCVIALKKVRILPFAVAFCLMLFVWTFYQFTYDYTYFSSRLSFANSTNFSVLVYLSGLERAFLNFTESLGLGTGFQQMGYNGVVGESQKVLESLGAGHLNLYDGSFIASKFISEFGLIGLIFCILFTLKFIKSFISFNSKKSYSAQHVLAYCFLLSFIIPLFIRGAGYLNPYVFMMLSSMFMYRNLSKKV
ncbi:MULTISPECIES: hypothetical protein [Leclercia]|uniref:hypothetical protein n=1 Tax=Leclercia TaxID=83654 RepID=UPI000744B1C0|nr:hypothetical protein [Leclercia adecarboxylata]ALZ95917.1 hypothetical protein APT61_07795 [Leclercia adecarboxylata]MCH2681729.1 hypothetical protein [Leclercia adecarboxylata]MCU6674312.1 hypothetical protein [Leclercia adecarboxylata]MCV3301758.1 hypothetical protein [Leclercia adecarboxylata]MCV3306866.1 hypothetical protein [Leclercia adecarboxylata]